MPYALSRFASPWRGLSVHTIAGSNAKKGKEDGLKIASYNIAHGRGLARSNWQAGTAVIDWILFPADFKMHSYRVATSTLSDHRPVVAEFSFKQAENSSELD